MSNTEACAWLVFIAGALLLESMFSVCHTLPILLLMIKQIREGSVLQVSHLRQLCWSIFFTQHFCLLQLVKPVGVRLNEEHTIVGSNNTRQANLLSEEAKNDTARTYC
jgi:hypothetical protein